MSCAKEKNKQEKNKTTATATGHGLISLSRRRACCLLSYRVTDSVSTMVVRRVGGLRGIKGLMDGWAEPPDVGAIGLGVEGGKTTPTTATRAWIGFAMDYACTVYLNK